MKRITIFALALMLMIAGSAFAQRRGPGGGGPGHGPGHGEPGGPPPAGLIVADNGTVFVTRTITDSGTDTRSTEIKAISSTGATLWTITLANGGRLSLSGNNVLLVNDASTDSTIASKITAYSMSTGAQAWTVTVNGRVHELEPFSGGTYAVVVNPPASEGAAPARSLVAISSSGATLWTVNL